MPDDDNLPQQQQFLHNLSSVSSASTRTTLSSPCSPSGYPALDRGHFSQEANAGHQRPRSSTPQQRQYRPRSPTPQRRQQRFRSRSSGLCWYHNYFGSKASKCDPPCSYAASNEKGEY
ncbi:hypothetical protein GWK47_051858 [Chionoecetes opilio]|uniref:Uncharacterized protein n=1 Tax=Chionoecetes opilio TaxID=41210 RepID=A0A8J4Y0E4_CHIOP|nr:hypothetical protein GWK47_051858 [Chionoecetes opilio]